MSALGTQVAGVIDAVGPNTAGFARNDRVAFRSLAATDSITIVVAERDLIGIPADVSLDAAAVLFPCALLARTVVKQVHSVGRGNHVSVTDVSVIAPFVAAWVSYLGGTLECVDVTTSNQSIVISGHSIRAGLAARSGLGLRQQAASDVFAAMRAGAFAGVAVSTAEEAQNGSRAPVLLRPSEVGLAA